MRPRGGAVRLVSCATMLSTARGLALPAERFSVAPMMDYTDRHFRYLFRLLSRESVLYTEMVAANTLCDEAGRPRHGDVDRWLGVDDASGKTFLQLGGADPSQLAGAARLAADYGYAGVNLNCGCPSARVAGAGCFGAAMMRDSARVAECCAALGGVSPVTVKCRVGVVDTVADLGDADDETLYANLAAFVETVASESPVTRFAVHARVAVLAGLNPDANRKVPPLKPDLVARLAADFPHLEIVTNGEVGSLADVSDRGSGGLAGAMVGRDACRRPWHYASVDTAVYGAASDPAPSRRAALEAYGAYAEGFSAADGHDHRRAICRRALSLFHGDAGTGAFKRGVEAALLDPSTTAAAALAAAAAAVPDDVLDARPGAAAAAPPRVGA